MGKRNKTGLGRSLINDRFSKANKARRAKDPSILHSSEVPDGYDWGRLNLQSVTEQSSFQEFLSTAQLAGTEFQAEKLNITFVNPLSGSGLLTKQEKEKVHETQEENKQFLAIPRRPKWNESTTPEELAAAENEEFLEWRRRLAVLQEEKGLILTPYEKNLEFWRQLWRVVERSDIIVQIVDARNPLLFRCEDLEKYVLEVSPYKQNLILLNKADYLTDKQRNIWANYFGKQGVHVAFYSATKALEVDENNEKVAKEIACDFPEEQQMKNFKFEHSEIQDDCDRKSDTKKGNHDFSLSEDEENKIHKLEALRRDKNDQEATKNVPCDLPVEKGMKNLKFEPNEIHRNQEKIKGAAKENNDPSPSEDEKDNTNKLDFGEKETINETTAEKISSASNEKLPIGNASDKAVHNSHKLLNRSELISLFLSLHNAKKVTPGITTIGLVGYPNVGKSSTINSLLLEKKVSVSATPGKTKHFQTLFLDKDLLLCDCPGLVMPSFVYSKAEMIINGILSIDQMRDHVPPVTLVASFIPRHILEDTYGIMIPPPREGEDPDRPPTSEELLNAYGYNRGFMTQNGQPDNPRTSRHVLKDFVTGKLLYCWAPPDYPQNDFHLFPERRKKLSNKSTGAKNHLSSELDKGFFKANSSNVHVKGYNPTSTGQGTANPGSKPWKDHSDKRNKREKLRRVYNYLDK